MKNFIFVPLLLVFLCAVVFSQKSYDYPIKPGTEEWKSIPDYRERVKRCQIPDEILHSISTYDLVETCINYPFFGEMRFFDSMPDGFEIAAKNFNGFQELIKRQETTNYL